MYIFLNLTFMFLFTFQLLVIESFSLYQIKNIYGVNVLISVRLFLMDLLAGSRAFMGDGSSQLNV